MKSMVSKDLFSRIKMLLIGAGSVINISGKQALPARHFGIEQDFYVIGNDFKCVLEKETGKTLSENLELARGQKLLNLPNA